MRVLGIDPGSRHLGWGLLVRQGTRIEHIAHGVIDIDTSRTFASRLVEIDDELGKVIASHVPDAAAVESLFFAKDAQSAAKLGHARGVVLLRLARAGVPIVALDIGGGFPAPYGQDPRRKPAPPPNTGALIAEVVREAEEWGFGDLPLIAEPGRVIVARCLSLIVRVLLKKGRRLYINDGIWASLSDSWTGKITLPARLLPDPARRRRSGNKENVVPFRVCGATCDSVDILSRPFYLPETVDTGDWIEIGHIGAYSLALRTHFNGFYPDTFVEVTTPFEAGGPAESLASLETMAD